MLTILPLHHGIQAQGVLYWWDFTFADSFETFELAISLDISVTFLCTEVAEKREVIYKYLDSVTSIIVFMFKQ
jgi:hypothetical protein